MAEVKEVGFIEKNQLSKIVFSLSDYRGKLYFDIREHIKTDKYDGPTKKGLRMDVDFFEDFKELVGKMEKEIAKMEKE
ncbi:transcriptional coactivator p15/PC4 family protein [bacterium]|nr:transcriptional coactivator p15/PC4 family protein [bacterium]